MIGKRAVLALFTVLCLSLSGCVFLSGCENESDDASSDIEAEGIVAVNTLRLYGDGDAEPKVRSYVIADGRRAVSCGPVVADGTTVYDVPDGCFISYIDREQNEVLNRLARVEVTDEQGNPLDPPAVMEDIFEQIAELEHELMGIRVFDVGGEYFLHAEANVNWWTPCSFYYYNRQTHKLVELYTFSDEAVRSLRVLSIEKLRALS